MPISFRQAVILLAAYCLAAVPGCLNLGGRTTYVHEKPETLGRITALETRVGAIENAVTGGTVHEVLPSSSP